MRVLSVFFTRLQRLFISSILLLYSSSFFLSLLIRVLKLRTLFPGILIFYHRRAIFTLHIVLHVFVFRYLQFSLYFIVILIIVIASRDLFFLWIFGGNLYRFRVFSKQFRGTNRELGVLVVSFCQHLEPWIYGILLPILFDFFRFRFFIIS